MIDNTRTPAGRGARRFLTAFLLVGWLWSIWVGYLIFARSQYTSL